MRHESDQAAPSDWIALVNERADLDVAFVALDGWDHFHTDTIRGRIRSLQLRPDEAWKYFRTAEERADTFPRSLRNVLRRFYLRVYCFENAIIEESGPGGSRSGQTEELLRKILASDTPDSDVAALIRTFCQALYLVHQQNYVSAKKHLLKLLDQSRNRNGDEKAGFYLTLAATHRALGEDPEADRQMENACLAIPTLSNTFNMGIYAASVSAILRLWDREEEACEWDQFVVRLRIPETTARVFRERSRRILERSQELKRVFLF
jgi:hypothetical protein